MACLNCESCGGSLQAERSIGTATCLDCGKEYGIDDLLRLVSEINGAVEISSEQAEASIETRIHLLREKARTFLGAGDWSATEELINKIETLMFEDADLYLMDFMVRHEFSSESEIKSAIEEESLKEWEIDSIRRSCDEETLTRIGLTKDVSSIQKSQNDLSIEDETAEQLEMLTKNATALRARESERLGETQRLQQEEERLIALNKQYTKAMSDFESGEYEKAASLFSELGDLFDSKAMEAKSKEELEKNLAKKKRAYDSACAKMKQGDYKGALTAFKGLGAYEDSQAQAQEAKRKFDEQEQLRKQADFDRAEQCMADKKYAEARDIYKRLGSFGKAKKRLQDAESEIKAIDDAKNFEVAEKLLEEKKYDQASKAFKKLGSYSDSETKAAEAKRLHEKELKNKRDYQAAQDYVSENRLKEAIRIYRALGDYRDSPHLKELAEDAYEKQKRREAVRTVTVIAICILVVILIFVGMFLTHA